MVPDQGEKRQLGGAALLGADAPVVATPGPVGLISSEAGGDPLGFLGGLIEKYGDVVRYETKFGPCFLFVHPEHVQTILHRENYRRASLVKMMLGDGLLAIDGPRWRSQRRLMQKDFLPAAITPFVETMARRTRATAQDWKSSARDGEVADITAAMTRLTLRIVIEALFSEDLEPPAMGALCEAVTQTITDLGRISWTIFGVPVQFSPDSTAAFSAGKEVIDRMCYGMITRRRSQEPSQRPRDLLTLLIQADTEAGPMNDRELRDELVTMLVGGHETTALALTWAWKLLAEHPAIAAEMRREIDQVLAGRDPQLADLQNLPYVQAVFQEAMRLYPPVWYMARVANEDDVVHGHAIPRGACVLISAWFTHRHPRFWHDPDRFDPTRFINREPSSQPRYAWFPFGGGRHQCLGMHFSMLEGVQILAQLGQHFAVRPLAGEQVQPDPGITLRQKPFMRATIAQRVVLENVR
jgi:cytochrome P450